MYKINLHSHTNHSDGDCSIEEMALRSREIDYCAYVVTDHFYPIYHYIGFSTVDTFIEQEKECTLVSKKLNYPIIQGVELNLFYEEILIFGIEFIKELFLFVTEGKEKEEDFTYLQILEFVYKNKGKYASILCHPVLDINRRNRAYYDLLFATIDGFEEYNHGKNYFINKEIPLTLKKMKAFNNADAHRAENLELGFNIVDKRISKEEELIKYIKT